MWAAGTVYFTKENQSVKPNFHPPFFPFQWLVGLTLSSGCSHCMWAAGTTVYSNTKEN
jgi:hypothetical protein